MKKVLIILMCSALFTTCKYFSGDKCNNTLPIVGKYENVYDKGSKNILTLHSDGTFTQVYTKDNNTKKNTGTWKFFQESCNIRFKSLKLFHQLPNHEKSLFRQKGVRRMNAIMFIEGLGKEFDFYRIAD